MCWIYTFLVMLALPLAAHGEILPDGGVSAPEVAAVLSKAGYPADMIADRTGEPSVRSSTGKVLFIVRFHECGAALRCTSIEFTARNRNKMVSAATIAAWNREKRFGRVFQDKNGACWIAMDVETSHGMTTEALEANMTRWIMALNAFETFVMR